jgi:hypothetical protein
MLCLNSNSKLTTPLETLVLDLNPLQRLKNLRCACVQATRGYVQINSDVYSPLRMTSTPDLEVVSDVPTG